MANNCYIKIWIIGQEAEVERAEAVLKELFHFSWNESTKRQMPNGSLLAFSYPWRPPVDELEEVFEAHSNLIFLMAFWEDGLGIRGRSAWAYGYEVGFVWGSYGPDGDKFYDEIAPLPDILSPWRDPLTRKTPAQVAGDSKDKVVEIESQRQVRRERLAAKEQKLQLALAEIATRAEREYENRRRQVGEEARVKAQDELDDKWLGAEMAIWPKSREDAVPVIRYLLDHRDEQYAQVANKFGWGLSSILKLVKYCPEVFDGENLFNDALAKEPELALPATPVASDGRLTKKQAEEFFRQRKGGWANRLGK